MDINVCSERSSYQINLKNISSSGSSEALSVKKLRICPVSSRAHSQWDSHFNPIIPSIYKQRMSVAVRLDAEVTIPAIVIKNSTRS